jgi:antitoxin component HigA of HigAB toxin-antitoxin module
MRDEEFRRALAGVLNEYDVDGELDTPDFILADFLDASLSAYEFAKENTDKWYGRDSSLVTHLELTGGLDD